MKALAFSGGKDSLACFYLLESQLNCAIYVDTGYSYPETKALVNIVEKRLPLHIVKSDKTAQNNEFGIPSDVVPINWTNIGQKLTNAKSVMVQSYLDCCWWNISYHINRKAVELGVTELICGQRNEEGHKATSKNGEIVFGIKRTYPIEHWTEAEVFAFLKTKIEIPEHFKIKHSSLDCYDCTAYAKESKDRIEWTKKYHPIFFEAYNNRKNKLIHAMKEEFYGNF